MSALDPEGRDRARSNAEERYEQLSLLTHDQAEKTEPSVTETLRDNLDHRSMDAEQEHAGGGERDADPVWTWNAPDFLTGDTNGKRPELGQSNDSEELSLKEKTENLRLYFGSLEDYERRKGGRTHYRIILSFDVPATNRQIRDLTNTFLDQAFPKAIAFGAIHRDTDHPHVHLYLNSRQTDGRRIQLKNNEFKTIDEKWSRIYTDFAGDRSAYVEYLRKKEETKQWKIAAAEAYRKGEPIPPKPARDNDRRERLAEQRLSAQRSEANDRGEQFASRPQAEPLSRAASEKQTSRLLARTEVAREHLAHLIRTDAPDAQIKSAARFTHDLSVVLEKTVATREETGRRKLPQVVYTTEEWKQLKEYRSSNNVPVKDDRAAARLQAGRVLAGAEMRTAQEKDDAFHASYHFWKFDVEGWDRRLSLVDVEKAIKDKAEKFKLYNFLRPSKREEIQGQIDYLRGVKKDIQKQLASKELSIEKCLGAAESRYQIACKQVEQIQKARAEQGKEMPAPSHTKDELGRMNEIAVRDKNAGLLLYIWDQVKDRVLAKAGPEDLGRLKGSAVMAKLDMVREKERLDHAVCFGEFRHLPNIDKRGYLDTQRLRDVSPRNALETIIRHFTDSVEQKELRRDLTDTLRQQVARAQEVTINAREYSAAVDKILGDHCRAARVAFTRDNPSLNQQQIAEVREFTQKLPSLNPSRIELNDWARQGEQLLQAREAAETARQAEQARSREPMNRSVDQSSSQERTRIDRSDRDSYSRGR
jgi:hypothetical protein